MARSGYGTGSFGVYLYGIPQPVEGAASISASSAVSATSGPIRPASSTVNAVSTVSGSIYRVVDGSVTIYGPSSIVTASDKIKVGRSHIYANSVTSFKGYIDAVASSSSTSVAGLSARGEFVVNGAAQISASASVTPSAIIKHGGSCAITASATTAIAGLIVKDANITVNAEVLVSPSANATLVGGSIFDQYANISSGSAVEYVSSAIIETLCIITPNGRLKWETDYDTYEDWTPAVDQSTNWTPIAA